MKLGNGKCKVIIVTDEQVIASDVFALEMNPQVRRFMDITQAGDLYAHHAPFLNDPGELRMQICGQVEFNSGAASDGWTRLMSYAISKLAEQQVTSAIQKSVSSTSTAQLRRIEGFTEQLLMSLGEAETKGIKLLKRRSERASRYLSATAYGLKKSGGKRGAKKAAPKRKMPSATRAKLDARKRKR